MERREKLTFSIGCTVETCRHPPEGKEMPEETMMHSRVTREVCLELWIGIKEKKIKRREKEKLCFFELKLRKRCSTSIDHSEEGVVGRCKCTSY